MTNYQIYGRTSYEQPLTFIRELTVEPASLAEQALGELGAQPWIELIAVPSGEMLHVIDKSTDLEKQT